MSPMTNVVVFSHLTRAGAWPTLCLSMSLNSLAPLSPEQVDVVQRAIVEVASSGGGFGIVAIVIEKGEPRRVQQMKDYFFLSRAADIPPPVCAIKG